MNDKLRFKKVAIIGLGCVGQDGQEQNNGDAHSEHAQLECAQTTARSNRHLQTETEFFFADEELASESSSRRGDSAVVKARSRVNFEALSPFPHCVLPDHFFERYSK